MYYIAEFLEKNKKRYTLVIFIINLIISYNSLHGCNYIFIFTIIVDKFQ